MDELEVGFEFQDVVCDSRLGTGAVKRLSEQEDEVYSVIVAFENGEEEEYTSDGKLYHCDAHRSLYHGPWEQVFGTLPKVLPVRKVTKYFNLTEYKNWVMYDTEEDAIKESYVTDIATAVPIKINK